MSVTLNISGVLPKSWLSFIGTTSKNENCFHYLANVQRSRSYVLNVVDSPQGLPLWPQRPRSLLVEIGTDDRFYVRGASTPFTNHHTSASRQKWCASFTVTNKPLKAPLIRHTSGYKQFSGPYRKATVFRCICERCGRLFVSTSTQSKFGKPNYHHRIATRW